MLCSKFNPPANDYRWSPTLEGLCKLSLSDARSGTAHKARSEPTQVAYTMIDGMKKTTQLRQGWLPVRAPDKSGGQALHPFLQSLWRLDEVSLNSLKITAL